MILSDDDIDAVIRERIRSRLDALKWSQRRLAVAAGVSPMLLSQALRGEVRLSAVTIAAIAGALGCTVDELLPETD